MRVLRGPEPGCWLDPPTGSWLTAGPAVAGVALTGAVGWAIALGLARAATYAERVEEDQFCHASPRRNGVPR